MGVQAMINDLLDNSVHLVGCRTVRLRANLDRLRAQGYRHLLSQRCGTIENQRHAVIAGHDVA